MRPGMKSDVQPSNELLRRIREQMLAPDDILLTAEFFKALSDPTRLSIINALQLHEWLCVTDLAEILGMTKSAVSHQLCNMRMNKLVRVRREGQRIYYALNDVHVEQVCALAIDHIKE